MSSILSMPNKTFNSYLYPETGSLNLDNTTTQEIDTNGDGINDTQVFCDKSGKELLRKEDLDGNGIFERQRGLLYNDSEKDYFDEFYNNETGTKEERIEHSYSTTDKGEKEIRNEYFSYYSDGSLKEYSLYDKVEALGYENKALSGDNWQTVQSEEIKFDSNGDRKSYIYFEQDLDSKTWSQSEKEYFMGELDKVIESGSEQEDRRTAKYYYSWDDKNNCPDKVEYVYIDEGSDGDYEYKEIFDENGHYSKTKDLRGIGERISSFFGF